MRGWWIAGAWAIAMAWILCYVMQAVARDPFPPQISISQYGVGPHGWIFSWWMLTAAAGPCLLYLYRPVRGLGAGWWLLVGLIGAAVMAVVRTDPGGLQQSLNARIHMSGSVLTLAGLPIGCMLILLAADRVWRWTAITLAGISAAALELLLVSAGGFDTTGAGLENSWAFWQGVTATSDLLLSVAVIFGVLTIRPRRDDPEPWWTRELPAAQTSAQRRGAPRTRTDAKHLHSADSAS